MTVTPPIDPTRQPSAEWDMVTLKWLGRTLTGATSAGVLTLRADRKQPFLHDDPATPVTILPDEITAPLTAVSLIDGGQSREYMYVAVNVPASDDPDILGSGFTYTASIKFANSMTYGPYTFTVPYATPGGVMWLNKITAATPFPGEALPQISGAEFDAAVARIDALEAGATGGAPAPVAFDTYTRKPDGTLQGGFITDSGHVGTVRASIDQDRFKIADGALVHARGGASGTSTTLSAAYAGLEVPGRVGRAWIDFEFTDSNSESAVIIVSGGTQPFTQPLTDVNGIVGTGFTSAAAHLVILPDSWTYGILTGTPFGIEELAAGWYTPPLAPGVRHTFRTDFDGDQVTITDAYGVQIVRTDPRLGDPAFRGEYAAVELFAGNGVNSTETRIVGWGAAQEAPLSAREFQAPDVPTTRSFRYMPATELDVTVPGSSAAISSLFILPCQVPSSARVLVTVQVYLEQTGSDTVLLMGLNMGTGTGDGLQRVVTGPYSGVLAVSWLWEPPSGAIGATVTLRPEAFIVGTAGSSHIKFSSGMGYYGQISYQPVA